MLTRLMTEEEIEEELDKLHASQLQRKIMKEKGEIMGKILDMAPVTVRGFFTQALIEWQKRIGTTLTKSEDKIKGIKERRIKESEQIFAIFRKKIFKTAKIKGKEHLLDKAIHAAQNHYIDNYADRPYEKDTIDNC